MVKSLGKIKCILKRWHSSNCMINRTGQSPAVTWHSSSFGSDETPPGYQPVYVGMSRRRYLLCSDLIDHPLFQSLLVRSGGGRSPAVVECEVVLFEHLLWMLENADPKSDSFEELVEFYAY